MVTNLKAKILLFSIPFFFGLVSCKQKKIKETQKGNELNVDLLISYFFSSGMDSILNEPNKNIILIAKNREVNSSLKLTSKHKNYIFLTDTLTFNNVLQDTTKLKLLIPIYVKTQLKDDTVNLMIFKHNKEIIHEILFKNDFNGDFKYIGHSKSFVKFRHKLPFNN